MTPHPSPRYYSQLFLAVAVEKDTNGQHYVHVRKTAMVPYQSHPQFTPNEAEALARDISNAAAEARRKNVASRL